MQSKAVTVDLYLKEVPSERIDALTMLRQLCIKELKGYIEIMRYGMPCYEKDSVVEVSFASQKNNITLYILKQDVIQQFKNELKGASIGKGCIRFIKPEKIDFDLVAKMLAGTYDSKNTVCG